MVHSKSNSKQIKLYDYQQAAFKKLVVALKTTFRTLLVMATGLGKTILSIEVVKYFITPKDKILFLCHDNGILNKAYKDYKKLIGDQYTYAKFYGDEKDWEADKHHFVFATFQSVLAHLQNKDAKKKLFSPKHFSFIVVDESHHAQAETFAEVINYFKPKYKLGMTATPDREDQADIRDIFGQEVVDIRLPEAIAKNWLTKIDYKVLSDGLDEEKIREVCKEVLEDNIRLTEKQINEKIFIKVRTEEQCKIVQKYSKTQKAIVFCENIEHLRHVASILPSSVAIHSEQSSKVNDANFNLFEHGHVQHVIVVDKFNEGIDIPDTELLVFLRATNSERIFLQQLGRGLRKVKGKEKVAVLDFVANIDRIKQVAKLTKEIERFGGAQAQEKENHTLGTPLHVEGNGFRFDFSDQVVNLLSVFERLEQDFYPTWQDASEACRDLGIKTVDDYSLFYKDDYRLPSKPSEYYVDFPGYRMFFKGETLYGSWEEASVSAKKFGFKNRKEYHEGYKQDPRLPSYPHVKYEGFPGYDIFLGLIKKEKYKTWQEASEVCQKLGITNYKEAQLRVSGLPTNPNIFWKDWPGMGVFFSKPTKEYYQTWEEASNACRELGVTTRKEYNLLYKNDPMLHSNPDDYYQNFPGYDVFLKGTKKEYYPTWQDASEACRDLGITLQIEYKKRYKEDPKLPSTPDHFYSDFPGYSMFLRGDKRELYPTWQDASEVVRRANVKTGSDYQNLRKIDPRLPNSPSKQYKDYPGWKAFIGEE